jgi:plastocyanin
VNHRVTALLAALSVCAVVAAGLIGCGGAKSPAGNTGASTTTAPPSGPVVITEENYEFSPASVTINVGGTITFENKDDVAHRVSVDGHDLGQQAKRQKVTWKATTAGTFPFTCTIHPDMTGQVTVK